MYKLALALLLVASAARAMPAPLPALELERRADLVIEAESKSVACVGEPSDRGDFVSTEYRSELEIKKLISGKPPPGTVALSGWVIEWKDVQPDGSAPPAPPLPKGWRGKLYLASAPGGGWMPVWYNAIVADPSASPEPLPKCGSRGCGGCALPVRDDRGAGWCVLGALIALAARRRALTRWSNA